MIIGAAKRIGVAKRMGTATAERAHEAWLVAMHNTTEIGFTAGHRLHNSGFGHVLLSPPGSPLQRALRRARLGRSAFQFERKARGGSEAPGLPFGGVV
jgi:hypothetical protein